MNSYQGPPNGIVNDPPYAPPPSPPGPPNENYNQGYLAGVLAGIGQAYGYQGHPHQVQGMKYVFFMLSKTIRHIKGDASVFKIFL